MKIGVVTRAPQIWGAETSLCLLLPPLRDLGIDPLVILDAESPLVPRLDELGLAYRAVAIPGHPALRSGSLSRASVLEKASEVWRWIRLVRQLVHAAKGVDLLIAFDLWDLPAVLLAGRLRRIPVVLDLHESFAGSEMPRALRWLFRRCDAVVSPSRALLRDFDLEALKSSSVVPRPIAGAPPGLRRESAANRIGIVGQVSQHKGHELFVDAIADVQRTTNWEGVIIGGGDEASRNGFESRLRARVANSGARIAFVPKVRDLYEQLSRLAVVVNVSEHEAFGRTVAEGLAVGAFPIVNRDTGCAEIVEATGIGLVIDRTCEDLARAIKTVAGSPELRSEARERGPESVRVNFGPPEVARRYASVLEASRS